MEAASTTSSAASSVDGARSGGSDYLNLGMFSAGGSSGGDLLVGGAGFGPSSLNGFGNDGTSSTPGTSFDLSDFPSLGGTSGSQANAGSGNNGLAAALRQQQLLAHQQQQQHLMSGTTKQQQQTNLYRLAMTGTNGNFNMATEDFPALSGALPSGAGAGTNGANMTASLLSSSARAPANGGLYGSSDLDTGTSQLDGGGLLGGAGLGGLGALRGLQQQQPGTSLSRTPAPSSSAGAVGSSTGASGSGSAAGNALSGDYGLLGLLGVIRMTDADRNALALGSDLTMLGLNLGSTEQIYSTFTGPWSDGSGSKEPHYQVGRAGCGLASYVSILD